MAVRRIVTAPAPVLSQVCAPVQRFDGAWGDLVMDLFQSLYAAGGRGLAAPQVGVAKRVFVTDTAWKTDAPRPKVFVNAEIAVASSEFAVHEEQCLSIPDTPVRVARPTWVELRWQSLSGRPQRGRFDGFDAICIQHERDHLDGILITDARAA